MSAHSTVQANVTVTVRGDAPPPAVEMRLDAESGHPYARIEFRAQISDPSITVLLWPTDTPGYVEGLGAQLIAVASEIRDLQMVTA